MLVIRTAEEMARALDSPLDPEVKRVLESQRDMLAEYEGYSLEELAEFVVVRPGDAVREIEVALGMNLIEFDGEQPRFALGAERVEQHSTFFEVLFILSDDGFGVLLFVLRAQGIDPALQAACEHELRILDSMPALDRH